MRLLALASLVIAACGDDDSSGRGDVTILVTRDTLPVAEATIVFHDATGGVLGTAETDANGTAVGRIGTRGAVTVFDPAFEAEITTITRVEIGSTLEVPLRAFGYVGPPALTLTVTAPATPAPPDTAGYSIETPCGREFVESLPATITVPARCGPGAPVIVIAYLPQVLDSPSRSLAWVATQVGDDGVAQLGAWSTQCSVVALDADVTLDLSIWPRFGMHVFEPRTLTFCDVAAPAQPTLDLGEGLVVKAAASLEGSQTQMARIERDFEAVPSQLELTTGDDLLLGAISLDSFDSDGLSWSPNDALAGADAIDLMLEYSLGSGNSLRWRFVLPPSARGTLIPDLPSELVTWRTPTPDGYVVVDIRYLDASWIDGDLATVHRELPQIVGAPAGRYDLAFSAPHDIPRGSALRDYWQTLLPGR